MRKANSKETRRAVEAYVMQECEGILERCEIVNPMRPVDAAFAVIREEMRYQVGTIDGHDVRGAGYVENYRKAGRRVDFTPAVGLYWTWRLAAAVGEFAVYYQTMRELVATWLDETPEEAARYNNDQVSKLYGHLTAQAFERLHDRENTPHTVKTREFVELYEERNGGHYFERETLKYYGQTRASFTITAPHMVEDCRGQVHDCFRVEALAHNGGAHWLQVDYFDVETLARVFKKEA